MNIGPLLPTQENIARFREELSNVSEAELIAQEAKDPNMAPGIAARQLLAELRAKRVTESKRPHWTQTPGFIMMLVFGGMGIIAWLYPRQPTQNTEVSPTPSPPASSRPAAAASLPQQPAAKPSSQAASVPSTAASKSK